MTEKIRTTGNQIKIAKRYTIRYSKAGVSQYADFNEDQYGKINNNHFSPSWVKTSEIPSLKHANTIHEILEIIKAFSGGRAEIILINGQIPEYYYDDEIKKDIKKRSEIVEQVIAIECLKFFLKNIVPILIKNNWFISTSWMNTPVIIHKNEDNEWDNVNSKELQYIEYICYKLISAFGLYEGNVNFRQEHSEPSIDGFAQLIKYVPDDILRGTKLLVEVE